MTQSTVAQDVPQPGTNGRPVASLLVEMIMDHYRVLGELRTQGAPRRLVDALNSIDLPFVVVHDGEMDDPLIVDDEPRRFKLIQVHLEALLFAVPRSASEVQPDPFEIVKKAPVKATIAMRGYEIVGNVFLLPDLDPAGSQLLGSRHFIPVTDARITSAVRPDCVWQEDVVVVNLSRALLFAPHKTSSGSPSPSRSQRSTPPNLVRRNPSP